MVGRHRAGRRHGPGPRIGKYNKDGSANPIPGHNIRWGARLLHPGLGWFGFNRAARWPAATCASRHRRQHHAGVGIGAIFAMIYMWIK